MIEDHAQITLGPKELDGGTRITPLGIAALGTGTVHIQKLPVDQAQGLSEGDVDRRALSWETPIKKDRPSSAPSVGPDSCARCSNNRKSLTLLDI